MFFYLSKITTFLIDPFFYFFIFTFLLILFGKSRARVNIIFPAIFIAFFFIPTQYVSNRALYFLEHLEAPSTLSDPYDAVIVLSGMVNLKISQPGKIEFNGAVDRILKGMDLLKSGKAKYLIISGGDGSLIQKNRSEARLLRVFALRWGIDDEKIIMDSRSRNTHENAVNTAKLASEHRLKKMVLITSAFHMYRARGCFRQVGLKVDVLPVDYRSRIKIADFRDFLPSSSAISKINRTIHEVIGILVYRFTGRAVYL